MVKILASFLMLSAVWAYDFVPASDYFAKCSTGYASIKVELKDFLIIKPVSHTNALKYENCPIKGVVQGKDGQKSVVDLRRFKGSTCHYHGVNTWITCKAM